MGDRLLGHHMPRFMTRVLHSNMKKLQGCVNIYGTSLVIYGVFVGIGLYGISQCATPAPSCSPSLSRNIEGQLKAPIWINCGVLENQDCTGCR